MPKKAVSAARRLLLPAGSCEQTTVRPRAAPRLGAGDILPSAIIMPPKHSASTTGAACTVTLASSVARGQVWRAGRRRCGGVARHRPRSHCACVTGQEGHKWRKDGWPAQLRPVSMAEERAPHGAFAHWRLAAPHQACGILIRGQTLRWEGGRIAPSPLLQVPRRPARADDRLFSRAATRHGRSTTISADGGRAPAFTAAACHS